MPQKKYSLFHVQGGFGKHIASTAVAILKHNPEHIKAKVILNNFLDVKDENTTAIALDYLKPTAACQTKANARKNTGIAGITSTIGRNAAYASGRYDSKKFTSILLLVLC